jgi:hypothetical protein
VNEPSSTRSPLVILAAALLLGLLFAQVMTSIIRLSITFDEDLHIATGYNILRTGNLNLTEGHPALISYWMSWPLLLSPDVPEPSELPAWAQEDRRLFVRNDIWWSLPIDSWVVPARITVAWLALLLGAFLFRWASDWFGPRAGLFALALFVFDPNILAHSALATLDLGVTCLIFVTMYGVQRFLRQPSTTSAAMTGISLGLALAAKISALLLIPVSTGLMALWGFKHWRKKLALWLLIYLGVAFLTLWAANLFEFAPPAGFPFPLPAPAYWRSFLRVGRHTIRGNNTYLLGETYFGGRWYYFPLIFALKTPLPTLALSLAALWSMWRRPKRWWRELVLAILPIIYFILALVNNINLGYRHLLPILPFLYLFIARLAAPRRATNVTITKGRLHHVSRIVILALLLWQAIGTLRVWPFHLTFFNEIIGGPRNGYRYVADSNVDWGQGLKALRDYLEDKAWPDVRLSSFTFFIRPELYGVQATPLPPLSGAPPVLPARFDPEPGTYVLSASTLRGLQLVADTETYNWFWHREPDDIVANAMLVYHVPERETEPTWLGQCTAPVTPLSPDAASEGFGRSNLRMLAFDCTQNWVYPDDGESAGWYILHREIAAAENEFIRQQLAPARLSFEQKEPGNIPPLTIFEWEPQAVVPAQREETLWTSPVEWPPGQAIVDGVSIAPPVTLDGPLDFLGYEVIREEETTLVTYWRVTDRPDCPFSLMGHLVGADAIPVAVGDGLGVSWDQLQPGDVLVQRHTLPLPHDLPEGSYWLQTGAYWLDTLERWDIVFQGEAVGDRILLTVLEISQ